VRLRGGTAALLLGSLIPLAHAAEWHVAPDGDDQAPGDRERPFASVRRAQTAAAPGDTVWLRGGRHVVREEQIARRCGIFAHVILLDKSGEPHRPLAYRAAPGERPVFDFSAVRPTGLRVHAFQVIGSWLVLEGFAVTGVQVTEPAPAHTQSIALENHGSHNRFERLAFHDSQAIGFYLLRGSHNLVLNCDAWNNWDRTSGDRRGGNVDGFGAHPGRGAVGNLFRHCRAWHNSDDGFDLINAHEAVTLDGCWAAWNGYSSAGDRLADGHGFKAGGYAATPTERLPRPIPRHTVRGCIAVGNKNAGFYANHHPGGIDWEHNSAHHNGTDFLFLNRTPDNREDVDGYGHRIWNNLSTHPTRGPARLDAARSHLAGNAFAPEFPLTARDFLSLDASELSAPRGADGALPELRFLRPAPGSRLIGGGASATPDAPGPPPTIGALPARP
jgi:hypothetical protein